MSGPGTTRSGPGPAPLLPPRDAAPLGVWNSHFSCPISQSSVQRTGLITISSDPGVSFPRATVRGFLLSTLRKARCEPQHKLQSQSYTQVTPGQHRLTGARHRKAGPGHSATRGRN